MCIVLYVFPLGYIRDRRKTDTRAARFGIIHMRTSARDTFERVSI